MLFQRIQRPCDTAQALTRWRHPVASSEALDALHRAMRQDRHGWAFHDNSGNGYHGRHPHLPRLTNVPPLSIGCIVPQKYRQGDQAGPIRRSCGDDLCDAKDNNDRCDFPQSSASRQGALGARGVARRAALSVDGEVLSARKPRSQLGESTI